MLKYKKLEMDGNEGKLIQVLRKIEDMRNFSAKTPRYLYVIPQGSLHLSVQLRQANAQILTE